MKTSALIISNFSTRTCNLLKLRLGQPHCSFSIFEVYALRFSQPVAVPANLSALTGSHRETQGAGSAHLSRLFLDGDPCEERTRRDFSGQQSPLQRSACLSGLPQQSPLFWTSKKKERNPKKQNPTEQNKKHLLANYFSTGFWFKHWYLNSSASRKTILQRRQGPWSRFHAKPFFFPPKQWIQFICGFSDGFCTFNSALSMIPRHPLP